MGDVGSTPDAAVALEGNTNDRPMVLVGFLWAAAFWLCYLFFFPRGGIGNDFSVFYRAAGEPLNSVYALRETNPFVYPPTTLLWLKPLAHMSWGLSFAVWTGASICAFTWATGRLIGLRLSLLAAASPALATTFANGQFGALVGSIVLLAVSLKGWRQGLLLGLAATIKPQIVIAAPFILLARRDWLALVSAALGAVTIVLVQLLALGWHLWPSWLTALHAFPQAVTRANAYAGSASPAGFASFLHLPPWPFLGVGIALATMLTWTRARSAEPVELAALIVLGSLLMSPYMLVYDVAAVLPFAVRLMVLSRGRNWAPAVAVFFGPFAGVGFLWLAVTRILSGKECDTTAETRAWLTDAPARSPRMMIPS